MRRDGFDPDQIAYTSAVGALGRQARMGARDWARGARWPTPASSPTGTLHTLLRCLTSSRLSGASLSVYERADAAGRFEAASTAAATLAAIGACAAAARQLGSSDEGVEQARKAVSLLQRLAGGDGRGATVGCYRAAVDACCAAGEWRAGCRSGSARAATRAAAAGHQDVPAPRARAARYGADDGSNRPPRERRARGRAHDGVAGGRRRAASAPPTRAPTTTTTRWPRNWRRPRWGGRTCDLTEVLSRRVAAAGSS